MVLISTNCGTSMTIDGGVSVLTTAMSILSLMWHVRVVCIDVFALLIGSMVHAIYTVTFATMLQRFLYETY